MLQKPLELEIAEKEIGQHELVGGENSRIVEYHSTTTLKATEDEIPWCSSFVNWCMIKAGHKGTNSALAKSWLKWGQKLDRPTLGCVCIIKKKIVEEDKSTGSSTGYHVAFWLLQDAQYVHLLGGNQSDSVKISRFNLAIYAILGYRIP